MLGACAMRTLLAAACFLAGSMAMFDYLHVARDPLPTAGARIARSSSLLFGHAADFRAVHEAQAVDATILRSAMNFLVTPVLMERWASYLEQSGRHEDARAVLRRRQEFASRSSQADRLPAKPCAADQQSGRWRSLLALEVEPTQREPALADPC